jgi:flagellar assembly protein FliH
VARKLAPNLIEREPFAEISAAGWFRELVAAPHIVVRVNDGLYAAAREKIDDIARAQALAGRLVVHGEPNVAPGDCRIEWADGGVHRDAGAADRAIGEAVARYISARRTFADAS